MRNWGKEGRFAGEIHISILAFVGYNSPGNLFFPIYQFVITLIDSMAEKTTPPIMESSPGAETVIDGKRYLYFGGTSYLGLAGRPEVIEAACEAVRRYGIHSATSRGGFGTNPATAAVERLAAEFFAQEDAFYFASGYVGNHILIQALTERFDCILADELAHSCLQEAAKLPGKPIERFRHRDTDDLDRKVRQCVSADKRPLVMSDGIFAVTGAIAPIDEYLGILSECETATLLIDDAHGFGTLGENGRGTLEFFEKKGMQGGAETYVSGTLSKALGGFGGILSGSATFVDRAKKASHYFDGASAPPSPVAGASAKALEIVLLEPQLRKHLQANVAHLRRGLREIGLAVEDTPSPVIGMAIGNAENMRRIHRELKSVGILLPYSTYRGAGKEGTLRIAVFATHTADMLDRLLDELRRLV
jgi:7-keto-8-aminopelargonate synthetase-like enzyme